MNWFKDNWYKIVAAAMLFYAIGDNPYAYYTFLRITISIIGAYSAYYANKQNHNAWKWIFIVIAVLFNPVFPFYLSKDTWAIIDFISGTLFCVSFLKTKRILPLVVILITTNIVLVASASAHRSGCHRWHSCPSDSGSYTCGDAGHPCQYPTYPSTGGVVYPPSGYYKDCYNCPLKKVPSNASVSTSGTTWSCDAGYKKVGNACEKIPVTSRYYFISDIQIGSAAGGVTELQNRLTQEGVYSGPITGYFGALTKKAVKSYQAKYGIMQTGMIGPLTRAQLNKE